MTSTHILPHLPPHKIHITHLPSLPLRAFQTFQTELTSSTSPSSASSEYTFLDASTILSATHLLAAIFQATRNELVSGKRRTRNVHSEVVYCLGGNNNIKEAYKKFGVTEETKDVIAVKIAYGSGEYWCEREEVEGNIRRVIGEEGVMEVYNDEVAKRVVDVDKVRKYYKIKAGGSLTKGIDALGISALEVEVLGKMVGRVVG
ncbi:CGI-121-domain-containing protein [Choiromyces venosus 120613-1]|uniref:EKC/KEOPS complex subunit CGI121 n=1 Tax=Choiromyces venosus 120613-1 TaxID=1336337 RepID=A0A3N4JVH0_9PEZI|nr:CGI-121-domain-containing protein [Choiromyces venosus 120613-1]